MGRKTLIVGGAVGIALALATGGTGLGLAAGRSSSGPQAASDSAACSGSSPKLTVSGTGMATGTPDLLTVSVGIDVTDSSAQASLADDNSKGSAVTTALKQGGTLDKDIQTSNLSIQPHYDNGEIAGYEVTNDLTANLHDFSSAGAIIDALAAAAGNSVRVNSLTFSIQDPRGIEDQARTDAVQQAVSHARSMAMTAGERLGPVCSLSDQSQLPYEAFPGALTSNGAAAQVPLAPGTQQASAQVTIVYALVRSQPKK